MNLCIPGKNHEKQFLVSYGKRYFDKENGINLVSGDKVRHLSVYSNNSILKFGLCPLIEYHNVQYHNVLILL
jgi:hypothetical protein